LAFKTAEVYQWTKQTVRQRVPECQVSNRNGLMAMVRQ